MIAEHEHGIRPYTPMLLLFHIEKPHYTILLQVIILLGPFPPWPFPLEALEVLPTGHFPESLLRKKPDPENLHIRSAFINIVVQLIQYRSYINHIPNMQERLLTF